MIRKVSLALAIAGLLVAPSTASAAVNCTFAPPTLTVTVTGASFQAFVERGTGGQANDIIVSDENHAAVPCAPTPTVTTTDTINIDASGATGNFTAQILLDKGAFAPGVDAEGGSSPEIEFTVTGSANSDGISVTGGDAGENLRYGSSGGGNVSVNLNGGESAGLDADITGSSIDRGFVEGGDGQDTLTANGTGFPAALSPVPFDMPVVGDGQDDQLAAGNGPNNILDGGSGNDTMTGGTGGDSINVGDGNDTADGGAGIDFASYLNHGQAITLDLRITAAQNTGGAGTDTLSNFESAVGSNGADTMTGTDGPNTLVGGQLSNDTGADTLIGLDGADLLSGGPGNDLMVGGGGNDNFIGEAGSDTISYATGSTGPVTMSLNLALSGTPQPTGGAGSDTLSDGPIDGDFTDHEIENIIGSPFGGDTLTGNGVANVLTAYGDGLTDTVDCVASGDGDTAVLDELAVEVGTNCEANDNAPQTSISTGPGNGATTNDSTPTYGLAADEPSSFQLKVDGGGFAACAANCDVPALADGNHTLQFRARDNDENQNVDPTPVQRTVIIDTVGPAIQIDERPDDPTNSSNPIWRFSSAEGGLTFECQVDGGGFAPCNGTVAHSAGTLPDGPHTFAVRGRDSAGNAGPTLTDDFAVDRTGPDIQITQRPAELSSDNTPTWQFSGGEADVVYTCIIDGGDPVACSGPGGAHTSGALADGNHSLVVFGRDALGNQGATVVDQFAVDTRAPGTDAPQKIKTRKKRVNVPFEADEQQVAFECSFDGVAYKACTSPFRTPKMKRHTNHVLLVRATDQAGNADQTPSRVKIKRKR